MIDNAVDVICTLDSQERFEAVSASAKRVLGYDGEELFGKELKSFLIVSNGDAAVLPSFIGDKSKIHTSFETRWRRADGTAIDLLWSANYSSSQNTMFCIARDVTERNKTLRLLKLSEARNRVLMESMPVGLVVCDREGNIEFANETALYLTLFGDSGKSSQSVQSAKSELFGEVFASKLLADNTNNPAQDFVKWIAPFLKESGTVTLRKKNGQTFPVELSARQLPETSEHERYVLLFKDITERQEIERVKREFVAMISHDLRTPLSSIKTTLATFSAGAFGEVNDQGMKSLDSSAAQTDRLIALVSELLEIESIETGQLPVQIKVCMLKRIVADAIGAVESVARKANVELVARVPELDIYADPGRLVQVLVNLLGNAIRFSPPDSAIEITAQENPDCIEIRIRDRGPGIPEDKQQMIFQRFTQLGDNASESVPVLGTGTGAGAKQSNGLGLAICKAIIEAHGGQIGVDSVPGQGSTFWLRMPLPD